jgi:tetratricopeptide (TPR) repeat protein
VTENRPHRRQDSREGAASRPHRLVRAAWPFGLLLIFAAAFRAPGGLGRLEAPAGGTADVACDHAGPDVTLLERCLSAAPDDIELMLDLGESYETAGRTGDAEALYRRALRVDARDGDAHVRLGRVLLARGDRPGAWREGEAALVTQPGNPDARRLIEDAAERAGP